jgi:DNA-binding protein YbaB
MQAQIGAMLDEYRAVRSRIDSLQMAAINVATTVRSPDRSVTVTVDAQGGLRDLRIDPTLATRLGAKALADRILAAARLASAQAREQFRVTVREALPERLRELVQPDGSVDLEALLPVDPGGAAWERRP